MAGTADNSSRVRRDDPRRQGRYVLGELLGRGGMAEVFAGNSIGAHGFQKPVAIKRLLPELANDEVFVERLIGEAKLLVGMAHGNIVSVLDLARDGDDVIIVMEFVDGPSLRQLMKARGSRGVSLGVATYVVQAAAAGLEFAHNRPGGAVIHADISPSNILLTTSGEVRVADFGIARREGGGGGVVEGKWAYMAPEQARGEALTPRSDVFALGVVLYELLCGEHPLGRQVTAGDRELAPKRIVPPRVVKASIPAGLDAICMKALSYEPHDRYARMQHVIDALVDERFANGYREGANDLAQMIREVMPGTGPAKEQTQHTARPVTIVTRSLISALNLRASSPQIAADPPVPKLPDSGAQTRAIPVESLPPELRPSAPIVARPSTTSIPRPSTSAMHRPEGTPTPTPELPLGKL
ncbi:MAG TPA: protein kinase, partial [Kofleriaceae bacterium]